jgi:hypothetical protein
MTEFLSSLCYNQLFTNHSQLLFSVIVFLLTYSYILILVSFKTWTGILGFQYFFSIVQFSRCKLFLLPCHFFVFCTAVTAFILYHIFEVLSSLFSIFFWKKFSWFLSLHSTESLAVFDSLSLFSALFSHSVLYHFLTFLSFFQIAVFRHVSRFFIGVLAWRLYYYTTLLGVCQHFSQPNELQILRIFLCTFTKG